MHDILSKTSTIIYLQAENVQMGVPVLVLVVYYTEASRANIMGAGEHLYVCERKTFLPMQITLNLSSDDLI